MALLDHQRISRESPNVTWLSFVESLSTNGGKCVHFFYEGGDDPSFYEPMIKRRLPEGFVIVHHRCHKKRYAIQIYKRVDWTKQNRNACLFFVDKDLQDYTGDDQAPVEDNFFVTEYYSIENYYVRVDILREMLIHFASCPESHPSLDDVLEQFVCSLNRFYTLARRWMVWIIAQRLQGAKINLQDSKIRRLFAISLDGSVRGEAPANNANYLQSLVVSGFSPLSIDQYKVVHRRLSSGVSPKKYVRGKYEFAFFIEYFRIAVASLEKSRPQSGVVIKDVVNISVSNGLVILGPRVPEPPTLAQFLDRALGSL